jgi:N-methylhydantoinase A
MKSYLVGVDIGGTFTDCVVIDDEGAVITAKAPSTPDEFSRGMLDAMTAAADSLGLSITELCQSIRLLAHGTTVGTNAVVQKRGDKVGLITTKGHNDVIHIMRGSRGVSGRDMRKVTHFPESQKPDPIIPKRLVEGISERVDCFGKVVVDLNEDEVFEAVDRLIAQGVNAIAVCFLWSFKHPAHEQRVREIIAERAPDMFVTCSSDLVPKWGEYERTTAVALNAYIGPLTSGYLNRLHGKLRELGYEQPLQITQCGGGTISVERAMESPLLTLDSGPVSGVTGSKYLGDLLGFRNVITTDMGGTSFDVGIIHDGEPAFSYMSLVNQYEYFIPKVDIQAIGNGGGSLVTVDEATQTLRVGPESAGAVPGPICYKRGGKIPTVTDAALVLGYIAADSFAGGRMTLDFDAAETAIAEIAGKIGMTTLECAAGIAKISEFQMADLIRKMTIQKGLDPRDFVLFAFGGAGPMHASVFAFELGVQTVIIPQKKMASTWCAFGAASADIRHIHEQVDIMVSPFDFGSLKDALAALRTRSAAQLSREGVPEGDQSFTFSIDMRHKGQINEVEVPIGDDMSTLHEDFYVRYEQLYGKGAAFRGAKLEAVTFRVRGTAVTPKPMLTAAANLTATIPEGAVRKSRAIYWTESKAAMETPVYDGEQLVPGNLIAGPVVVETPDTTVVVHPGRQISVDPYGNLEIGLVNSEVKL